MQLASSSQGKAAAQTKEVQGVQTLVAVEQNKPETKVGANPDRPPSSSRLKTGIFAHWTMPDDFGEICPDNPFRRIYSLPFERQPHFPGHAINGHIWAILPSLK